MTQSADGAAERAGPGRRRDGSDGGEDVVIGMGERTW